MSRYYVILENSTYKLELRPSDKLVYLLMEDSLILNGDGNGMTDWINPDVTTHIAEYWQIPPGLP
jgi:hypothetical protein